MNTSIELSAYTEVVQELYFIVNVVFKSDKT